jgi:hypothetical protein
MDIAIYVNVPFDLFSQKGDLLINAIIMRMSTKFPIKSGLISIRVHGNNRT